MVNLRNILGGYHYVSSGKRNYTGNTVVIEDEDIKEYDGAEVVVTLLDYPKAKKRKAPIDWDGLVKPSERGKR